MRNNFLIVRYLLRAIAPVQGLLRVGGAIFPVLRLGSAAHWHLLGAEPEHWIPRFVEVNLADIWKDVHSAGWEHQTRRLHGPQQRRAAHEVVLGCSEMCSGFCGL